MRARGVRPPSVLSRRPTLEAARMLARCFRSGPWRSSRLRSTAASWIARFIRPAWPLFLGWFRSVGRLRLRWTRRSRQNVTAQGGWFSGRHLRRDGQFPAQLGERRMRSLHCSSDDMRGCGAPVTILPDRAPVHPSGKTAPSDRAIKDGNAISWHVRAPTRIGCDQSRQHAPQ